MIINRAIIKETPLYYLFAADNIITPGFVELVPKLTVKKKTWMEKVWRHLETFSDPLNITGIPDKSEQITYQPTHRFSFSYLGGSVAVVPNTGRVEIEQGHPRMEEVVDGLILLATVSQPMRPTSPSVHVVVNNM